MPHLNVSLCLSFLCKWAIRILTMSIALKRGCAVSANGNIFSSCTHCTSALTACSISLIPQIPVPTVPTYQPTTSIPHRLEAIQTYIRDLQYPSNVELETFEMLPLNAYFLYTSWHPVDLVAFDFNMKTSGMMVSPLLIHIIGAFKCYVLMCSGANSRQTKRK